MLGRGAVAIHQPIWVGDDLLVVRAFKMLGWEGGLLSLHGVGMRTHGLRVGVGNWHNTMTGSGAPALVVTAHGVCGWICSISGFRDALALPWARH